MVAEQPKKDTEGLSGGSGEGTFKDAANYIFTIVVC
jgi:hypothetical protein